MILLGIELSAIARELMQKGASTTLRDNDGWTVFDYARMSGINLAGQ